MRSSTDGLTISRFTTEKRYNTPKGRNSFRPFFYGATVIDQRLAAIAERWNKVEYRLKEIEAISGLARIPAINELRYAGRQIIDALSALSINAEADVGKNITSAAQYVQNADHDVTDAIVDFIRGRVEDALRRYGMVNTVKNFPDMARMRDLVFAAEEKIRASRLDRSRRDAIYDDVFQNHVVPLVELYQAFRVAEPNFIYDQLLLERGFRISKWFNGILAVCTILGFVYGALAYYGW